MGEEVLSLNIWDKIYFSFFITAKCMKFCFSDSYSQHKGNKTTKVEAEYQGNPKVQLQVLILKIPSHSGAEPAADFNWEGGDANGGLLGQSHN